jgi:hypothetical protein
VTGPQGWLTVPYDGPELAPVEIGVDDQWFPAFLHWQDGRRVAMIRAPLARTGKLSIRVAGVVTPAGFLRG